MSVKWRGYYKAIVLYLLSSGPMSGYEMIKTIEGFFKGKIKPSPGTIYPLLKFLEEEGYITSEEHYVGKKLKRIYKITEEGRKLLNSYFKDQAFAQLISYLQHGEEEGEDILSSIIEEVRFLSEIFDEIESADMEKLRELRRVLEEFSNKISKRLQ